MTEELDLYESDRTKWLVWVAPRMAQRLTTWPDATLGDTWARIPRDYQMAVWALLDDATRERIKRIRKEAA